MSAGVGEMEVKPRLVQRLCKKQLGKGGGGIGTSSSVGDADFLRASVRMSGLGVLDVREV